MKGFEREDQWLSLCGLNCGLCPMKLDGRCPGCGGGEGNQSCAIARCSLGHGGVGYCFRCGEYPCGRYEHFDDFDSFITHRNRKADMERARREGPEAYRAEQQEKAEILRFLLENYQEGRRKTFYCVAVNLLDLSTLKKLLAELSAHGEWEDLPPRERADRAAALFQAEADKLGLAWKLRRKPRRSKG